MSSMIPVTFSDDRFISSTLRCWRFQIHTVFLMGSSATTPCAEQRISLQTALLLLFSMPFPVWESARRLCKVDTNLSLACSKDTIAFLRLCPRPSRSCCDSTWNCNRSVSTRFTCDLRIIAKVICRRGYCRYRGNRIANWHFNGVHSKAWSQWYRVTNYFWNQVDKK